MSNFPRPRLLTAPDKLPDILIPNNNTLRMLVNCYQLCKLHFVELTNIRRGKARMAQLYNNFRLELSNILADNCITQHPILLSNDMTPRLRAKLASSGSENALMKCAALLRALNTHIADRWEEARLLEPPVERTSDELGNIDILITQRRRSAIAETLKRTPRREQEISDMLINYHPDLHLTPLRVGDWQILSVNLRQYHPKTIEQLDYRVSVGRLKIGMSPLSLDSKLEWRSDSEFPKDEPVRFHIKSVTDERAEIDLLSSVLQRCHQEGISILVLPELRMPPNLLQTVKEFLNDQSITSDRGLLLVAAGSWHVEGNGGWVNRCQVLDCRGKVIWEHDKLAEYNITADNVKKNPSLKQQIGISDFGGTENIQRGTKLEFCDCALGRISVAICAGFLHEPLMEALKASGSNIFLVPTMTTDIRPIEERARDLIRSQQAATFAANCGTVAERDKRGKIGAKSSCFYLLPQGGSRPQRLKCPSTTSNYIHAYTLNRRLTR